MRRAISRPRSTHRTSPSWGGGYSHRRYSPNWGSSGGGNSNPVSMALGVIGFVIVAAIMVCSTTGNPFGSSSSSSFRRATNTPVVSEVVRAEVMSQWTVTVHTTQPREVTDHEKQADCEADPDCEIVADSCASEEDLTTCHMEIIPETCEVPPTPSQIYGSSGDGTEMGIEAQAFTESDKTANCYWRPTGEGRWVDVNCHPDPADPDYEICEQEYQVEEEWVCEDEVGTVMQCDERRVCDTAIFCDTTRIEQADDKTYTSSGVGPEVTSPDYEVAEGGTVTEEMIFEVRIVGVDYDVALDPAPTTLRAYQRAVNTVYYILAGEDGEPFGHITAAELETGEYPSPRQ